MRYFTFALFAVALLLTAAQADDWSKTYTVEGKFNGQDMHGKLNGGGNRMVVHTGDGSITVDKT